MIGFALLLAFAAHLIGAAFRKLTAVERRVTAMVMIAVGVFLLLRHNFGVNI